MSWHKIESRRPDGMTDAEWIAELEEGIGSLLETIGQLDLDDVERYWPEFDLDDVERYWPEFEGYAASLGRTDPCPDSNCFYCGPVSITAVSADWIDPTGDKPTGWRERRDSHSATTIEEKS